MLLPGDGSDVIVPREATIIAVLSGSSEPHSDELRAMSGVASGLEVRADATGDLDPDVLRAAFPGQLLYALRSSQDGGAFTGSPKERRDRLIAAAERYDVIDLEADRDLIPEILARVPPSRRRISWHGRATDLSALRREFGRIARTPARLYLMTSAVTSVEQALAPLLLLKHLRRADVTAFGTGAAGTWSRLLAPWLGAPVIFGRPAGTAGTGMPTLDQILTDYPFPALPPLRAVYGIIGKSVGHSFSPCVHNAAYRALGLPALYLPFPTDSLFQFWHDVAEKGLDALGLPLLGATVISPHKEAALAVAAMASPATRLAGSANALLARGRCWLAETTDTAGALEALTREGVRLAGRRAAIVGCGGAGRAAAAGLLQAGAEPTLVNRGMERGRYAARLLGLPFVPLAEFSPEGFSLVVHATPISRELPFPVETLREDAVVLDFVYGPAHTPLIAAARSRGIVAIDGWQVLRVELERQFSLMTGRSMPERALKAVNGFAQLTPRQSRPEE